LERIPSGPPEVFRSHTDAWRETPGAV